MDSVNRRLWLILLIALFLLAGSVTAAFATMHDRDFQLRGYVDATQSQDLPYRIPRMGVNAELTQYTPDELPIVLDQMRSAHIIWVRQFVHWQTIETARNEFDWSQWDAIFAALEHYPDLSLIPVFFGTPHWARVESAADQASAPPADPSTFAAFAAAFAERYGTHITTYQIWDEPNLRSAWGGLNPQPADYAAILTEAASAIRNADPDARILAAALAPTIETGPHNLSDLIYLRHLYALGVSDFIDGFAAKPYGFNASSTERITDPDVLNFSRAVLLREIMVANGDARKPLWISEYGWNALPEGWAGDPSIWGSVTPDQQVEYTLNAIQRAEREWTWLGGMILTHWQPNIPPDNAYWGFALVDQQGAPKPLLNALQTIPPSTSAGDGLHFAITPYAYYSGVWTFSPALGADIGWIQDSQLSFRYRGRDVALLLRQGDYEAYLYPTIDGIPANALPRDTSGNAYINLKSDALDSQLQLIPASRGLANSDHVLRVIADRGWDQYALVGYAVSSGNLAAPYNTQIDIAWFAAFTSSMAAVATAFQLDWSPILRRTRTLWLNLGNAGQISVGFVTSFALLIGMFLTWHDVIPSIFRRDPVQIGLALLTAGVIYLQPGILITLVAGAILFVIVYHRVELGLMLTILYAPFFLFPVELLQFAFPMSELVILITGAAWLLRTLAERGRARRSGSPDVHLSISERLARLQSLDWAMLAWGVIGIVSLAWATYRSAAFTELRTLILEPILFYTILRLLPPSRKRLLLLIDTLLIAGALVCIIGLFMFSTGIDAGVITAEGGTARLASVYGSPNNVALFLGRCLPFALAFALTQLDPTRRRVALVLSAMFLITLFLTLSAGSLFIGIPAVLIVVLFLRYGKRAFFPVIGLLGVGTFGGLIAAQSARFARLLDFTEGTNFFRIRVWESAVQMIRDQPLTGIGLDQFLYLFRGRYMLPDAWQEPNLSHPHNILLDYWTRLGVFGVALLVYTQIAFWRTALFVYRTVRERDPMLSAVVIGTMGAMANLVAHGLVDNSVFVHDLTYIFALMMGIVATLRTPELLTNAPK